MGGLYLGAIRAAYRRQRERQDAPLHPLYDLTLIGVLLSPGLLAWARRLALAHSASSRLVGAGIGMAIVCGSGSLIAGLFRGSRKGFPGVRAPTRLRLAPWPWIDAALGVVAALAIPLAPLVGTQVGLGLITNKLVEVLLGRANAAREFTLPGLVRSVYQSQANACLLTLVGGAAAVGLWILVLAGITAIAEQRAGEQA
jgi:hypothetical protein